MTSQGSPHARFKRALAARNALVATAAAAELPRLSLADALALCLLYRDKDPPRFQRAAVRWHALLCLELRITRAESQLALAAVSARGSSDPAAAARALAALLSAHEQRDAVRSIERWLEFRSH